MEFSIMSSELNPIEESINQSEKNQSTYGWIYKLRRSELIQEARLRGLEPERKVRQLRIQLLNVIHQSKSCNSYQNLMADSDEETDNLDEWGKSHLNWIL